MDTSCRLLFNFLFRKYNKCNKCYSSVNFTNFD